MTGDAILFFPLRGKPPCPVCQQPEGVELHVGETGWSVTQTFQHKPECLKLRCPHGVLWRDDCSACDAERANDELIEDEI